MTSDERANAWRDLTRPFKDAVSVLTQPAPGLYALLHVVEELPALSAEFPLPDFSPLEMLPGDSVVAQNMATDQTSKSSGTVARAAPQQAPGLRSPASSLPVPRRLRSPLPSSTVSGQESSRLAANTSDARSTVFPLGTGSPAISRERPPAQSDEKLSSNKQGIDQSATAPKPAPRSIDSFSSNETARLKQPQATASPGYEARQQEDREHRPRVIGESYVDVNAASQVGASPLIDEAIRNAEPQSLGSSESHSFKTNLWRSAVDHPSLENEARSSVSQLPQAMAVVNQLADEALQKTEGEPLRPNQPDLHSGTPPRMKKLEGAANISSAIINDEADHSAQPAALLERGLSPSALQKSSRAESSSSAHQGSSERSANLIEPPDEVFSSNTIALIDELADGFMRSRMDSERQPLASGIRREPISTEATSTGSTSSPISHGFISDKQPRVEYAQEPVSITANNSVQGVSAPAQSKTSGKPTAVNNPQQQPDADKLASLINDILIEQARRHGVDIS